MRNHADFIPELAFVLNGETIGNIMYARGKLIDKDGNEKPCLSFGPISIALENQRKDYGEMLIEHSFKVSEK